MEDCSRFILEASSRGHKHEWKNKQRFGLVDMSCSSDDGNRNVDIVVSSPETATKKRKIDEQPP